MTSPMHTTADHVIMRIADMTDSHLLNTIRLWQRKAKEGLVVMRGGGFDSDEIWFDEDVFYGDDALEELNYGAYVREAKKRGLEIP